MIAVGQAVVSQEEKDASTDEFFLKVGIIRGLISKPDYSQKLLDLGVSRKSLLNIEAIFHDIYVEVRTNGDT